MQPKESWRPVAGFEGIYEVSDRGHIRSLTRLDSMGRQRSGRTLRPRGPAQEVVLSDASGKTHSLSTGRLVWQAFRGEIPPGKFVGQINGNRYDCRLDNLVLQDSASHRASVEGRHAAAKLTEAQREEIRRRAGRVSGRELAKQFGVDPSLISRIVSGQRRATA